MCFAVEKAALFQCGLAHVDNDCHDVGLGIGYVGYNTMN